MKEKTIPKTSPPRRVKGTVLFTVVCVMMVLIVFLMGTLALAATANNRAMKAFNKAQTQQTAIAAVDAITAAINNDDGIRAAVYNLGPSSAPLNVTTNLNDPSYGTVTKSTIEYYGKKYVMDDDTNSPTYMQMIERAVYKVTAEAAQGDGTSTVSAYIMSGGVIVVNNGGDGGGFITTGGASMDNHVSSFGGAYLGFDDQFRDPTYVPPTGMPTFKVANGEAIETDFQVNGNYTVDNGAMVLVVKKPGTGMTVWGDLTLNKPLKVTTVNAGPANLTSLSYTKIPFIYVDKTLSVNFDNDALNDANTPLNIFCGDMDINGNGNRTFYANVYCHNAAETSVFKPGGGSSMLYKWSASVITSTGQAVNAGSFYSKGSLQLDQPATFDGEVMVEKDLIVNNNVTVNGNVTVGGELKGTGSLTVNGGTVFCDHVSLGGLGATIKAGYQKVAAADVLKPGVVLIPEVRTLNPGCSEAEVPCQVVYDGYVKFTKPDGTEVGNTWYPTDDYTNDGTAIYLPGWGNNRVDIPTYTAFLDAAGNEITEAEAYTIVPEHYEDASGNPVLEADAKQHVDEHYVRLSDGATVPASEATSGIDAYANGTKYPAQYEKTVITGNDPDKKIVSTVSELLNKAGLNPYNATNIPNAIPATYETDVNAAANQITVSGGGDHVIDKSCTLSGGLDGGRIVFKVKTGEEIWVKTSGNMTCSNNSQWVLDDLDPAYQGKVNILLTGNLYFTGNNLPTITTTSIEKMINDDDGFQIAESSSYVVPDTKTDASGATVLKYPRITDVHISIYSDTDEHELKFQNSTRLSAKIKSPYLNMVIESGGGLTPAKPVFYNGFNVKDEPNSNAIGCVGCCVVKSFSSPNNWVVLFVPEPSTGGLPAPSTTYALVSSLHYDEY